MNLLLVIIGAAVGAPLRYLADRAIQARGARAFPAGTLTVNLVACLVLGVVTAAAPPHLRLLMGTGLCATLSTYSTFSFETLRLVEVGARRAAGLNVLLSVGAGLGAAFAGVAIGDALWG